MVLPLDMRLVFIVKDFGKALLKTKSSPIFFSYKLSERKQLFEIAHCNKKFMNKDKLIDHDHITGKYRGAAHSSCNLKLRIDPDKVKIHVFFHNLRGYNAHLIMQYIGEQDVALSCIPNHKQNYISFPLGQLVFNPCSPEGFSQTYFPKNK